MYMSNKIVIAPSVKHCGHHFIMEQIFKPEYTPTPPYGTPIGNTVFTGHFEECNGFNNMWFILGERYKIYIPLRHPARVLESIRRRGLRQVNFHSEFFMQWSTMMNCINHWSIHGKKVMYIHLDDYELRTKQAASILDDLDMSHKYNSIDWSVNGKNGSRQNTHDLDINDELLVDVPKYFIDFYENAKSY